MADTPGSTQKDPIQSLGRFCLAYPKMAMLLIAVILIALLSCQKIISMVLYKKPPANPVPVLIGAATTRDVPVFYAALGTVNPMNTVTVKTQINGTLEHFYFDEGAVVKAGQLLATIDSRPYVALLQQSEGALIRDTALLKNAKR